MKKSRLLWILPLITLLFLSLKVEPSFCWEQGQYGSSTLNYFGGTGELWQESGFYAQTLIWQFYDNDTYLVYKSSVDGITWSNASIYRATRAAAYMCLFNLFYDETTNKVHTVYAAASPPLLYRRGTPYSNGTIVWDAWQNVRNTASMQYSSPSITLDSNGYPWVASGEALDWEATKPAVAKSSTKDGTWTEEFWTEMSAVVDNWQCIILPLANGSMYASYVPNDSGWVNTQYGKLYNGTWQSEDTICSDSNAAAFGATSDDTHVYLTYHGKFREYTVGSGWGSETYLGFDYYGATLCIDRSLGELYRFGHHTDEIIYLQKRVEGVWGENVTVMDVGTELGYTEIYMGSWHEDSYGRIGVVFSRNYPDSTPYNHHLIMITIGNLYRFHGVYDEDSGLLKAANERAVNVTAYWADTTQSELFEVNGTEIKSFDTAPLYFLFDLTTDRQYWISPSDTPPVDIYIFDTTLTTYTIKFLDLAGVLDDYPFIEVERYINGTLAVAEKRKLDAENKIQASLKQGEKYTIEITDGSVYTFGDLLFTSDTSVALTLKGIEFPKEIRMTYWYLRCWGYRHNNLSSISVIFEETQERSCDVEVDIQFQNGSSVSGSYPYSYNDVTSFNHTWASANFTLSYVVQVTMDHPTYGERYYATSLARGFTTPSWSFPLGNIPYLNTGYILPAILILASFLVCSRINVYVGTFVGVSVAALLTWWNWIPIPPVILLAAFVFTILIAITSERERGTRI